ncbi:Cytochrome c oxidase assembly protein COX19 [Intoshia linei]|uniref:Cytochrome c oxidase assembly protein COX19 n=1 Tax=Intoshia linei TaxID=1819745 RepID=A0A177AXL1_9BILA|nr:Cytochrome c oxidase assembly protein COX19 [Intoshia linei]
MSYSSPYNKPKEPEKGSFPLDYDGVCKSVRTIFMQCLKEKKSKVRECKKEMRDYFQCRIDNQLMQPESMYSLGLEDED